MKILAEPIDVIAIFKRKEKPCPYKFKYVNKEGISNNIQVDKIICTEENRLAGVRTYIYSCQSLIGNELKRYELKYIIGECRWELYKL
ncbi:MAG: hypothetical protein AB9836_04800 [Aminipila sp.]